MRSRNPKQLILAFFGEHVLDQDVPPLRASVLIDVLEGLGVAAPATRATMDRLVRRGFFVRERQGREISFSLTVDGATLLRDATDRVRGQHPFDPRGTGWTLVTFSIPEERRTLRHRLRAALAWAGFAPLRDGLWIAPGEVDLDSALGALAGDLPLGAVTAFLAQEFPGYSMAANVASAWDLESIRAEHLAFVETWNDPSTREGAGSALSAQTLLVADWLALLRVDPSLPREFMDADWPSERSWEVYSSWRSRLAEDAEREFTARVLVPVA